MTDSVLNGTLIYAQVTYFSAVPSATASSFYASFAARVCSVGIAAPSSRDTADPVLWRVSCAHAADTGSSAEPSLDRQRGHKFPHTWGRSCLPNDAWWANLFNDLLSFFFVRFARGVIDTVVVVEHWSMPWFRVVEHWSSSGVGCRDVVLVADARLGCGVALQVLGW
jgi:hypothetical protein